MQPQSNTSNRICETCGRPFRAKPYDIKRGRARFCRRACADLARRRTLAERFWQRVEMRSESECWPWGGASFSTGYGDTGIVHKRLAHRVAYELHHGHVPDDQLVCHKCDNKICVNPNHLFLGTTNDNMQDKVKKGRQRGQKNGSGHTSHKLSEADVIEIRRLYATGKILQRELAARYGVHQVHISDIILRRLWKHV